MEGTSAPWLSPRYRPCWTHCGRIHLYVGISITFITQCHLTRTTADIVVFIHQKIPDGKISLKPWHSSLFVTATCSIYILLISLAFWCLLGLYYWTLFIVRRRRRGQNEAEFAFRFRDVSPEGNMIHNLGSTLMSSRLWGDLYA